MNSLFFLTFTVKLGDLEDGLDKFEKAHELAVSLSDEAAQDAINKATSDLKRKIADGMTLVFTFLVFFYILLSFPCLNFYTFSKVPSFRLKPTSATIG